MNAYNLHVKSDGPHAQIVVVGTVREAPFKTRFTVNAGRHNNSWEMRDCKGEVITTMRNTPKVRAIERALAWIRKLE